jgi:hypothetical protein
VTAPVTAAPKAKANPTTAPAAPVAPTAPVEATRADRLRPAFPLLLTLAGLLCWWFGVQAVHPDHMSDLGLVSVSNVGVLLAPALITAGFLWSLARKELSVPVVLLHVMALIVVLYGTAPMVEPVPGFRILYRHAGIVDYISRHGSVDPGIDAYFSWPGFFSLMAFVDHVAGIKSAVSLGPWAPAFFNLLYLGPLLLLYKTNTVKPRLMWLAVWFFYLANWIGQDYLSPQALASFSYLVVLAVILRWFGSDSSEALRRMVKDEASKPRGKVMGGVIVAVFASVVASHQLTPFAILAGIGALAIFRRIRVPKTLLIVMGLGVVAWLGFMTTSYLSGHSEVLTGSIGKVNQSAAKNVTARLNGSDDHLFIVNLRMLMTGALWLTAAAGWFVRRRRGHKDGVFALLAVATIPLVIVQPYGGEMLLRVYLFALPFTAFFAASIVAPRRPGAAVPWTRILPAALACTMLIGAFYYTRWGNESVDTFHHDDVAAVTALYRLAPQGSYLLGASDNLPWKATNYETYHYETVAAATESTDPNAVGYNTLSRLRDHRAEGAYFIVSDSQRRHVETFGLLPAGALDRVEDVLTGSGDTTLVYSNAHAHIYALNGGPTR